MTTGISSLANLILIFIAIILFYRIINYFFRNLSRSGEDRPTDQNLNSLISEFKERLKEKTDSNVSRYLEFKHRITKLSLDIKRDGSLKYKQREDILLFHNFFNELSWGNDRLPPKILGSEQFHFTTLEWNASGEYYFNIKNFSNEEIPDYKRFISELSQIAFLKRLISSVTDKSRSDDMSKLGRIIGQKAEVASKAIQMLILSGNGDLLENVITTIIDNNSEKKCKNILDDASYILQLLHVYPDILSTELLIGRLKRFSEIIDFIIPVHPTCSEKDDPLSWAIQILGLNGSETIKEIKKRYHTLVQIKHPDKIEQLKIDRALLPLANKNMSEINKAYDIMVKANQ